MIEHEIHGEDNRRTILFIHGALVTRSMWKAQIDFLQKDFRVITCDLPEHGKSPPIVGNYTVENLATELLKMISFVEVETMTICGHSLGGMVAQYLAYKHPEKIKLLILAETAFGTKNSFAEKMMTAFSGILLRLMTKSQIVSVSTHSYGKISEETSYYIAGEMSQYSKREILRI